MKNPCAYENFYGPVLGIVVDKHQWFVEEQLCPKYDTAISVFTSSNGEIQVYPLERGMVLKLVRDGKCVRQVQTKLTVQGSVDVDDITRGLAKLGFPDLNGTSLLITYFKTMQSIEAVDPIVRMKSVDGRICEFQIHGGILKPGKSMVTLKYDDAKTVAGKLDDPKIRELAAPFVEFVSCSIN